MRENLPGFRAKKHRMRQCLGSVPMNTGCGVGHRCGHCDGCCFRCCRSCCGGRSLWRLLVLLLLPPPLLLSVVVVVVVHSVGLGRVPVVVEYLGPARAVLSGAGALASRAVEVLVLEDLVPAAVVVDSGLDKAAAQEGCLEGEALGLRRLARAHQPSGNPQAQGLPLALVALGNSRQAVECSEEGERLASLLAAACLVSQEELSGRGGVPSGCRAPARLEGVVSVLDKAVRKREASVVEALVAQRPSALVANHPSQDLALGEQAPAVLEDLVLEEAQRLVQAAAAVASGLAVVGLVPAPAAVCLARQVPVVPSEEVDSEVPLVPLSRSTQIPVAGLEWVRAPVASDSAASPVPALLASVSVVVVALGRRLPDLAAPAPLVAATQDSVHKIQATSAEWGRAAWVWPHFNHSSSLCLFHRGRCRMLRN
mmetsp:Transcript_60306/g.99641  ORF Transcript_60306/g.99641 Transcript_60306/m.99641 type:complete len:426 (+) Transcript_60306:190-1467(+)